MSIERAGWYAATLVSVLMLVVLGIPAVKYDKLSVALTASIVVYLVVYYTAVILNTREASWEFSQYLTHIGKLFMQMWIISALPMTGYFFMPKSTALTIHWIFFMYIVIEGSIRSRDETTPLVF